MYSSSSLSSEMAILNYLVEGEIDEAVALKIIPYTGHEVGAGFGKKGWNYIRDKVGYFNISAVGTSYLALADFMDTGQVCPGAVIETCLPNRNHNMLLRIVVREIESWILGDRRNIANFLGVSDVRIPLNPETDTDPKRTLVNIARRSRIRSVRESVVPDVGSTAQVGKLYNSEIKRFVQDIWDPDIARGNCPSLNKCLLRMEGFTPN